VKEVMSLVENVAVTVIVGVANVVEQLETVRVVEIEASGDEEGEGVWVNGEKEDVCDAETVCVETVVKDDVVLPVKVNEERREPHVRVVVGDPNAGDGEVLDERVVVSIAKLDRVGEKDTTGVAEGQTEAEKLKGTEKEARGVKMVFVPVGDELWEIETV
jgi:hypothetical protein